MWIWNPVHAVGKVPVGACYFRCSFEVRAMVQTHLEIAADDSFEVFVNGQERGTW